MEITESFKLENISKLESNKTTMPTIALCDIFSFVSQISYEFGSVSYE